MLWQRLLVIAVLLPVAVVCILAGDWALMALVAVFLGLASWEFSNLFAITGYQAPAALVVGGSLLVLVGRWANGFESAPALLSGVILIAMAYHVIAFERGRDLAPVDFSITVAGILYLGWLGAYLCSLRSLPEGQWWALLVLCGVAVADSGAYVFGHWIGKHPLSPRLSPKKTWEGYFGGILCGILLTAGIAAGFQWLAGQGSAITPARGALVGLVMGVFPTLGDLGESMVKRLAHVKDSSNLLPGHGGFFDRVDSWLWAGILGYYLIVWLWI